MYYRNVTQVSMQSKPYYWQLVLRDALRAFKFAVIRWAMVFRLLHIKRADTHLTAVAPEKARERFKELIHVNPSGTFNLLTTFEREIDFVEARARFVINTN